MTKVERIELMLDAAAAAALGGALGYSLNLLEAPPALSASGSALALIACFRVLRAIGIPQAPIDFHPFDIRSLVATSDELVLGEADRLDRGSPAEPADGILILDDPLHPIDADSRVVRLFDRAAMPTPGELKARIDRHLIGENPRAAPPDASHDLIEALAELRRSLR